MIWTEVEKQKILLLRKEWITGISEPQFIFHRSEKGLIVFCENVTLGLVLQSETDLWTNSNYLQNNAVYISKKDAAKGLLYECC